MIAEDLDLGERAANALAERVHAALLQPPIQDRAQRRLVQIETGRLGSFQEVRHVHKALLGPCAEYAECAGHSYVSTLRFCTPGSFINQQP